jgi:hypothetical protein
VRHALETERTVNETVAMASDLFVCLTLLTYLGFAAHTQISAKQC